MAKNDGIFSLDEMRSIQNMINDSIKTSISSSIKSIIETTLAEALKSLPEHITRLQQTTQSITPTTSTTRQRAPYQQKTTMTESQKLWLMHSYERILTKTYEMNRYVTYTHFLSFRTPKDIKNLTHRFLNTKNKREPTEEELLNTANQLEATNDHITKCKELILEQQESISKMLRFHDITSEEITNAIDLALKTATNSTIYHRNNAYKDIYTYTSNAAIQSLHDSLRLTSTDADQLILSQYIELKKQFTSTITKATELEKNYDEETIPAYFQQHKLAWSGPIYTTEMETAWKKANYAAQRTLISESINMLRIQAHELKKQIAQIKTKYSDDTKLRVEAILKITELRQEITKRAEETKIHPLPASFDKLITIPYSSQLTGQDFIDLFNCKSHIQSTNPFIVTHNNRTTYLKANQPQIIQAPQTRYIRQYNIPATLPLAPPTESHMETTTTQSNTDTPNRKRKERVVIETQGFFSDDDIHSPPPVNRQLNIDTVHARHTVPRNTTNQITAPPDGNTSRPPLPAGPQRNRQNNTQQ